MSGCINAFKGHYKRNITNFRNLKSKGNVGKIIIKVSNNIALNQYNVKKVSQFICDSNSSYLVYGNKILFMQRF